jgi:predicted GTPase
VAGQYNFAIKELNSNTVYNGYFEILDFDIEKQFVNPDLNKLTQLASQTKGQVVFPNKVDALIKSLLENEEYKSVQKAIVKKTPLIDWIWLLILIAISLTSEWFIRKYNGML